MPELVNNAVEFIHDLPIALKMIFLIAAVLIEYLIPIFPGDTIVLIAGFLGAHGALDLWEISVAIIIGSLAGASCAYLIGSLIDRYQDRYPWLKKIISQPGFVSFSRWYQKWGALFLLLNRFFPGIRALFFVAAGTLKIHLGKVLLLGGLAAILFNACLIGLGYWVGFNTDLLIQYFYNYNVVALVLIVLIIIITIFFWVRKQKSMSEKS